MPRLRRLLDLPYLLLVFPPLWWAGNMVIARAVRGEFPPISLNWWRWSVASLVLLVFVHRGFWRQRHLVLRHWKLIAILAATGITAFHSSVYIGLTETTALNAALIIALGPVLIVPLAWLLLGERITGLQGLGVGLSFAGAVIVITRADIAVLTDLAFNRGDLWLLFASFCWGAYSVILKRRPVEFGELEFLVAIMLFGAVLTTPFFLWELAGGARVSLTAASATVIGYVSLFASVFAYIAWNRGVHLVGPNKAGLFLHLIPVYAVGLAALFLGERLQAYHLAGLVFILAGIVLTSRFGHKAKSARSTA